MPATSLRLSRKWGKYYDRVSALRLAGQSNKEIARRLRLPYHVVCQITSEMVREGKTHDGRGRHNVKRRPEGRRVAIIAGSLKQGATLAYVGKRLGVTRERVRQLRNAIESERGPIARNFLSLRAAAKQLGISAHLFSRLRRRCGVHPSPVREGSEVYTPEQVSRVQAFLNKTTSAGSAGGCSRRQA